MKTRKGFLLADVSMAIFLAAILASIGGMLLYNQRSALVAAARTDAVLIAQKKIQEIAEFLVPIAGKEVKKLNNIQYVVIWETTLKSTNGRAKLELASVRVQWTENGSQHVVMLKTYLVRSDVWVCSE